MLKQHKDLLRTLVAGLRHTLLGRYDDAGAFHPGDLDRELERLGVGRDGRITPLDALPYATFHERRAHRVAEAQLVDVPGAHCFCQTKTDALVIMHGERPRDHGWNCWGMGD